MSKIFIEKSIAKPGDIIGLHDDCATSPTLYMASGVCNTAYNMTYSGHYVYASNIGSCEIQSFGSDCDVTSTILTITENGKRDFLSANDFEIITNTEIIIFCIVFFFVCINKLMR